MDEKELYFYKAMVRDMMEGILTIGLNGRISSVNPAAMQILGISDNIIGKTLVSVFFTEEDNDAFCQAILDSIYQDSITHNQVISYTAPGGAVKQLFMSTSFIKEGVEKIGVTAVFSDVTELSELRDAVKAMEKIKALNAELEKRNTFIKKTFGRYLSDDIVNNILETENGLEIGGKKQVVTIMFTDLRGFTAISEKMTPRDLITMLNAYLERMIEIIMRHNGTILEFIGDAIVCAFGAPLESETSDKDAVECAIEMQCDMANVNIYNKENGFPNIEMGIGIHTGEVILGNIGSSKKTKYDIIGKNVNLASRVETYTVGGQILVSPHVHDKLGESLTVGKQLEIMPKGVKTPITIYEVRALNEYKMPSNEQHFEQIENPIKIVCFPLDGKHAAKEGFDAEISEFSENQIVLITDTHCEKNNTIRFEIGNVELYAKDIGEKDGKPLFHITSGSTDSIREIIAE